MASATPPWPPGTAAQDCLPAERLPRALPSPRLRPLRQGARGKSAMPVDRSTATSRWLRRATRGASCEFRQRVSQGETAETKRADEKPSYEQRYNQALQCKPPQYYRALLRTSTRTYRRPAISAAPLSGRPRVPTRLLPEGSDPRHWRRAIRARQGHGVREVLPAPAGPRIERGRGSYAG